MSKFGVIVFTAPPDAASSPLGAFVKVDGRECVLRSVELFVNAPDVAQIVIAVSPAEAEQAKGKFASHAMIMGFKLAVGGPALRDQLKAAAEKLPADVTHVIVHDAARVAVAQADVERLFEAATKHDAVTLVAPVLAGSLVRVDESGTLVEPTPTKSLRQLATPQAFARKTFDELVAKGVDSVMSRLVPLESSPLNVRVNDARDAGLAKALIALLPKPKAKASSNPFDEAQW